MPAFPLRLGDVDEILTQQNGPLTKLYKVAAPNTTIVNRALVTDFSKDLLPKFGITRFELLTLQELQGETGASGERVFKALNDIHDQVRFVGGGWTSSSSIHGPSVSGSLNTDYVEVTFYGTGLNLLAGPLATGGDWRASIDGGAEGANFLPTTISSVLNGRNTASNSIITVTSGLTLGTHTVKVRLNSAGTLNLNLLGFEVVGPATLNLSPGTSYVGGRKLTKPALTTDSYNSNFESGTLGTRGGHAVVYQKSDGSMGKAVQPTDVTPLYLSAANHVNESVSRVTTPFEFAAGRTDDFSQVSSNANAAFVLDDGTTSLIGSSIIINQPAYGSNAVGGAVSSGNLILTFVGTGLDIIAGASVSPPDAHAVTIDGVSVGSLTTVVSANAYYTIKIASGLPYGTHTVKITRSASASSTYFTKAYVVYAPAKPALPAGAIEICDYYLMANYVANTVATQGNIAQGVLRKSGLREFVYTGTGWSIAPDYNDPSGIVPTTSATGDSWTYVFFGTGFEHRWFQSGGAIAANATYTVDGSSNLSAFTTSIYANGFTFTASTGTIGGTGTGTAEGCGVQVSGLTLGLHKVTFTRNAGNANTFTNSAFDIITPVHSPKSNLPGDLQNTALVGSCAIGDGRKFALQSVKAQSNWSQALGVTANPTTTSTSFVPAPELIVQLKTTGNPIQIMYVAAVSNSAINNNVLMGIYVDGVNIGNSKFYQSYTATSQGTIFDTLIVPVAAGNHTIQIFWAVSAGTGTLVGSARTLNAREMI